MLYGPGGFPDELTREGQGWTSAPLRLFAWERLAVGGGGAQSSAAGGGWTCFALFEKESPSARRGKWPLNLVFLLFVRTCAHTLVRGVVLLLLLLQPLLLHR